jgi:hypothetical protein
LYSGSCEFKSLDEHFFFLWFFLRNFFFQESAKILSSNKIQAQKHQNWSKFHLNLQKEPKILYDGYSTNFFLEIENTKNERRTPNQPIKIYSISSSFAIFNDLKT